MSPESKTTGGIISAYERVRGYVVSGYVKKWAIVGGLIGIIAGFGSLALYYAISFSTAILLTGITGFVPPLPLSEGGTAIYTMGHYRYWLIPVSTTLGGLMSGILVYKLAPEAEGHGTDAAIEAFHFKGGVIRKRVPAVKLVASAITIGSGGSAGREGPVAQIAAGFGSFVSDIFRLSEKDRRIAVAAGIGAGIGSIFMAPFGGALLSTEILYRRDFEVDALIPSIIASVTGYAIFGYFFNYRPLFTLPASTPIAFFHPQSLILYAFVGLIAGLAGILYVVSFYGIKKQFAKMNTLPKYIKPAIGGLLVGLIAMAFPEVLGLGYGWVQLILLNNLSLLPLWILIIILFLKILATSFTIGSGGSGGVFAPGIVVGTFVGAVIAVVFHDYFSTAFPYLSMAEIAIVGMIAFFGGISKAPISIILMGTEMTGGYALFLPLMLATTISYFVSGNKYSIYSMQEIDRAHSPAHASEFEKPIMDHFTVREAMNPRITSTDGSTGLKDAFNLLLESKAAGIVVTDGNVPTGYIAFAELSGGEKSDDARLKDIVKTKLEAIPAEQTAHQAFNILTSRKIEMLAVIDEKRKETIGVLGLSEIAKAYNEKIKQLQKLAGEEEDVASNEVDETPAEKSE